MKESIKNLIEESIAVKTNLIKNNLDQIEKAVMAIIATYQSGGKLILFGNGGSAADAQHIAAEMVGRFMLERRPLPAIALNCNSSVVTAIGNDYGYENIYLKQIQAFAAKNDTVIGFSTSGNSVNVLKAIEEANKIGATTIGFCGTEGKLKQISRIAITVESKTTARIQESHIMIGHIICQLVEEKLFK